MDGLEVCKDSFIFFKKKGYEWNQNSPTNTYMGCKSNLLIISQINEKIENIFTLLFSSFQKYASLEIIQRWKWHCLRWSYYAATSLQKTTLKPYRMGVIRKFVIVTRLIERCNTERRGKHFRSLDVNNMQITNDNTWKLCIWFVLENIEKTTRLKSTTQITKKSIQKPSKRRKWYRGPLMRCEMFPLSKLYLWD